MLILLKKLNLFVKSESINRAIVSNTLVFFINTISFSGFNVRKENKKQKEAAELIQAFFLTHF